MASAPMTAEEALAKAAAEGLTLVRAGNTVGYKGVAFKRRTPLGRVCHICRIRAGTYSTKPYIKLKITLKDNLKH